MAKSQAVKKRKGNGKAKPLAIINDMFLADAGIGVRDLQTEDLAIPFLKVLQKMSPELDDLDRKSVV